MPLEINMGLKKKEEESECFSKTHLRLFLNPKYLKTVQEISIQNVTWLSLGD